MTVTDSDYFTEGARRALAMENRGPIHYDADGNVHPEIVDAYWRHGFYVFTGVIGPDELGELRAEIDAMVARAPYPTKDSPVDHAGNPALGLDMAVNPWLMAAPLSDPVGGTDKNNGRHPVKMNEPTPTVEGPAHVPYMMRSGLELSDAFLRVYGHPDLLRVAEALNGVDFTPFNEVLFIKEPGLGPSVAWHQDGQTHWNDPDWNEGIHGFNFQVQLYGSTPGNGVWVVPESHTWGKIDIARLVEENGGSERLPDAVPLVCEPGDCFITNRQTLHGSYANTSPDRRITVNFGFHRYTSVIDQHGSLSGQGNFYDEDYVRQRCRCIPLAIDARAKRFPDEDRYVYQPFAGTDDDVADTPDNRARVLTDYALRDLAI